MNSDDFYCELYGVRLLVFMETAPQSNNYHQVILNPDQFKRVSDSIVHGAKVVGREGSREIIESPLSEETYPLPDLKEIHEKEV